MSGAAALPPVAVITGGAGALGRAIAADYAERGDTVVLLDRDRDAVESAAGTLSRDAGYEVHG
ncbi:MAG: SDR family NAD(P)-dependent oxidoreductase, partial [Streptosporangiales bacterium]